MRQILFLMCFCFLMMLNPSCKKCMNCQGINKKTGKVVETYPENCGRKASLDNQELTYRANLPESIELKCNRD